MKIKIIESEKRIVREGGFADGFYAQPEYDQVPTGREWEIDIPLEVSEVKRGWLHIKGDLYQLIQHLRGAIR